MNIYILNISNQILTSSKIDELKVKVMHLTCRMSNQQKWSINYDEIWYEKVTQKIAPSGPIDSGGRTGVTGLFKFG